MTRWHTTRELSRFSKLPDVPGVYVVYMNGHVYYIGSSSNLCRRIRKTFQQYERTSMRESSFEIKYSLSRRYGDWLMREARLIRRLSPRANQHHVTAGVRRAR
jgi:excinuclease UvrABC nuclease subunit